MAQGIATANSAPANEIFLSLAAWRPIAIRTIVLRDGVAYLQAGAGIVADSDPAAEHDECLRKLAALETAITLAEAER